MPGKWSTGRKTADSFRFYMDHSDFKASRKDTNPIVLWLTVRELVQLERITFRAVPLYSGLLFFRSESDTFLMNYNITQTTDLFVLSKTGAQKQQG